MRNFEERDQRIQELAVQHTAGLLGQNSIHELMQIIGELQQAQGSQLSVIEMQQKVIRELRREPMSPVQPRPEIVCLCGSTRFMQAFHDANRNLSLQGKIVLTVEIVTYDGATDPQRADPRQKAKLDDLHLRKIDLADSVLILNVDGYIGESTRKELDYAIATGKPVSFLEPADQATG